SLGSGISSDFENKENVFRRIFIPSLSTDKMAKTPSESLFKGGAEREEKSKTNGKSIAFA
ncbi:MAG: hypothetical protein ACK4VL_10885, partial [Chitinophagales bacterium]